MSPDDGTRFLSVFFLPVCAPCGDARATVARCDRAASVPYLILPVTLYKIFRALYFRNIFTISLVLLLP